MQRGPYIDDDDQRQLADLQFTVATDGALNISIGATGPDVEPIGGYRGVRGANRYTAEELQLILDGKNISHVKTTYDSGEAVRGDFVEGRVGPLPERRLLPSGFIDYLSGTPQHYPLELLVNSNASRSGRRTTLFFVNGQPRLRCRYNVVAGKITDLKVQSLGNDDHVAQNKIRAASDIIPVTFAQVTPPVTDEEWKARDIEGRWVLMKNDIDANPLQRTVWVQYLAERKEFELLEWMSLYMVDAFKTAMIGETLATANSSRWLRVAAWHCMNPPYVGHGRQVALSILFTHDPGTAEDWLTKHKALIDNWEIGIAYQYKALQDDDIKPKDSSNYLLPFNREDVFKLLDAPETVQDFGNRKTADKDTVYAHQVARTIDAVIISGRRDEKLLKQVRDLINHDNTMISQTALLAFSYLAPNLPKSDRLDDFLSIVDDADARPELRESALMGYSFHRHPAVELTLLKIAADPAHPAWKAAVSRLGDIGHDFTMDLLKNSVPATLDAEHKKILDESLKRLQAAKASIKKFRSWHLMQGLVLASLAAETNSQHQSALKAWVKETYGKMSPKDQSKVAALRLSSVGEIWTPHGLESLQEQFEAIRQETCIP